MSSDTLVQTVVTYHRDVASILLCEVSWGKLFGFIIGGSTDELHPFTKSSETGLGKPTDSTALLSGIREISICANRY